MPGLWPKLWLCRPFPGLTHHWRRRLELQDDSRGVLEPAWWGVGQDFRVAIVRPGLRAGRVALLRAAGLVQIGGGALERQRGSRGAERHGLGLGARLQGQAGRARGELGVSLESRPGRWRLWMWLLLLLLLDHKLGRQVLGGRRREELMRLELGIGWRGQTGSGGGA